MWNRDGYSATSQVMKVEGSDLGINSAYDFDILSLKLMALLLSLRSRTPSTGDFDRGACT